MKGCHSDCCRRGEERRGKERKRGETGGDEVQWTQKKSDQSAAVQKRKEMSEEERWGGQSQTIPTKVSYCDYLIRSWCEQQAMVKVLDSNHLPLFQLQVRWCFNLTRHFYHEVQFRSVCSILGTADTNHIPSHHKKVKDIHQNAVNELYLGQQ